MSNTRTKLLAIEEMRNIVSLFDQHEEDFNSRIRSANDFILLYEYIINNGLEFIDNLPYNDYMDEDDNLFHAKSINKMLGYHIYNI